ncbi:hypothetical protein [Bacillus manliponensis]|nr:hypothetical protein [Bacillus manliponensis]
MKKKGESLDEAVKKRDAEFDQKIKKMDEQIEQLKNEILKSKDNKET